MSRLTPPPCPTSINSEALTPDQMLVLAARYEQDMKTAVEHGGDGAHRRPTERATSSA